MTHRDQPVLILGAGINGAAIARELALSGVGVVLVDVADIAGGATAGSTRLIHGGLRYLEYGEFSLVRESLAERHRLLQLAPHLVRPLRLFIPVRQRLGGLGASAGRFFGRRSKTSSPPPPRGLMLVRAGLALYDLFSRASGLPRHRVSPVGRPGSPPVDASSYRWLCSYHDAQAVFPERLTLSLLEDACRISRQRGLRFELHTYSQARLAADRVEVDRGARLPWGGGGGFDFQPAAIINATGAWVDRTLSALGAGASRLMGGTKGSHLVSSHAGLKQALGADGIYAEAADGRPVFLLPLAGSVLIGTTDLPFAEDPSLARADQEEIEYLLAAARSVFPQFRLTQDDVDFHYSGVRPLPYSDASSPAGVTRRHWVQSHDPHDPPLFSIIGGKLTTCRSLAEDAARIVLGRLGWPVEANSRQRPLPGGENFPSAEDLPGEQARWAAERGWTASQAEAIWRLVGIPADCVPAEQIPANHRGAEHKACDSAKQNIPGTSLPEAFVRQVIQCEWVSRLADLVERRLMLLYDPQLSMDALRRLAELMVEAGKLPPQQAADEVQACRDRLLRQFGKRVG